MNPLALIPSTDTAAFSKLPQSLKNDVTLWLKIVQQIDAAKSKTKAMKEIARQYPGVKGISEASIRRKFYAFKTSGWQALVNKSKLPRTCAITGESREGQPPAFIEFWKGLQENFQRNSKAAYRELIRRYRKGEQIPGIGNWRNVWCDVVGGVPPKQCPLDVPLPEGWTYRNLMRYQPTKFELTANRIGVSAASKFRPLVYTTRVGLLPGQAYVYDDVWHDNKVNYIGINRKAMRPLEFSCLDIASGCQVAWGAQPMLENEATGKREMLRETEMRFLLAHVLCTLGYHPDGCVMHVEHGTAAIRKELAELLFEWTGGAVTVARGGIHGAAAHDGFFAGRGKGNSRFKATLESHHNLKHNELAHLPGQVGKDRDHSPVEIHGRDEYNNTLIKAIDQDETGRTAQLLQLPYLDFMTWKQLVAQVYSNINGRTDHQLEGWEECGYLATEYRLSPASGWEPMTNLLAMPPERRAAAELMMSEPGMVRTRKLSPAEVWHAGQPKLVRLDAHYVPLILGERNAKMLKVGDDHMISFKDRRLGPGIHRYLAEAETESGEVAMLKPGRTYAVYATPFDTSAVFIASEHNEFIGIARRMHVACKSDTEAIHREIGKSMAIEKKLLEPIKRRHTDEARAKAKMHQHNAAVLRGDPITDEEIFREEQIHETDVDADDLAAVTEHVRFDEADDEFSADEISDLLTD